MKINDRHKLFVDKYIENGSNATQAWIDTSDKLENRKSASAQACWLLKQPEIQELINSRREELFGDICMDIKKRRARLTEWAMSNNSTTSIDAIKELNKMDGIYQNTQNITITDSSLDTLSEEELRNLLKLAEGDKDVD